MVKVPAKVVQSFTATDPGRLDQAPEVDIDAHRDLAGFGWS